VKIKRLLLILISIFCINLYASDPGELDTTFNSGGVEPGTNALLVAGAISSFAEGITIQDDGKILLCGGAYVDGVGNLAVLRLKSDGTLDTAFNSVGSNAITASNSAVDSGNSVNLQSNGKIVVGGGGQDNDDPAIQFFLLARFNTDGTLDTTFNSGGSKPGTNRVTISNAARSFAGAIQSDDKIVLAGYIDNGGVINFGVARFTADGILDTTFNSGGAIPGTVSTLVGGGTSSFGIGVALQSDGKIVVTGFTSVDGANNFGVARFTADGILDTTFNSGGAMPGTVSTLVGGGTSSSGAGVALQSDGKIVVTGFTLIDGVANFGVARFTTDGILDTTFNSGGAMPGTVSTLVGGGTSSVGAGVALQSDGKIVVTGFTSIDGANNFGAARFTTDGILDTTFNSGGAIPGTVSTLVGGGTPSVGRGVALQSDGKIVVTGYTSIDGDNNFGVARFIGSSSATTPVALNGSSSGAVGAEQSINLSATNEDENLLTFSIVLNPSNGTLSSLTQPTTGGTSQNATVTYIPNSGFVGNDSFTFKATNNDVDSNTATISITVLTVPIALPGSLVTLFDSSKILTLIATNADGELLTFSIVSNPSNGTLSSLTQPTTGGTSQDATVTYIPNSGFVGNDSFTFKATNNDVDSNIAEFKISLLSQNNSTLEFVQVLVNKYSNRV
jgi:uncharacterized delta-60 repeat protein